MENSNDCMRFACLFVLGISRRLLLQLYSMLMAREGGADIVGIYCKTGVVISGKLLKTPLWRHQESM